MYGAGGPPGLGKPGLEVLPEYRIQRAEKHATIAFEDDRAVPHGIRAGNGLRSDFTAERHAPQAVSFRSCASRDGGKAQVVQVAVDEPPIVPARKMKQQQALAGGDDALISGMDCHLGAGGIFQDQNVRPAGLQERFRRVLNGKRVMRGHQGLEAG